MTEPSYLSGTRAAYDTVAVDYAELLTTELAAKPLDRGLLAAFAEFVKSSGGSVADLGCGPGRVTGHLHSLGLDTWRPTSSELAGFGGQALLAALLAR